MIEYEERNLIEWLQMKRDDKIKGNEQNEPSIQQRILELRRDWQSNVNDCQFNIQVGWYS